MTNIQLLTGDALEVLKTLPDQSVQTVITSPPYYGLRDYNVEGQIGLEETPDEYIQRLVTVFREMRRVLRDDGTFWLNIGDSYAANRSYQVPDSKWGDVGNNHSAKIPSGCKPKDLIGIPWMLAFALRADGWYLRSDCIWHKTNPMPESVTDRPTKSHEYMFLLSKRDRYYYDADAVREPHADSRVKNGQYTQSGGVSKPDYQPDNQGWNGVGLKMKDRVYNPAGRNRRTVWTIATRPYKKAHFATFPPALVEPCVLAGSSAHGCCSVCGAPWTRNITRTANYIKRQERGQPDGVVPQVDSTGWKPATVINHGWRPTCKHDSAPVVPCVALDPFCGTATVGVVCKQHGRDFIGIDLNPAYIELAVERTGL